jgi:hypothetical protein
MLSEEKFRPLATWFTHCFTSESGIDETELVDMLEQLIKDTLKAAEK